MFSKTSFSLFIIGLFVFGFAFLSQPQSASAGTGPSLGCCINPGGNCNPGCGSEGDDCFRNFTEMGNGPCQTDQGGNTCGGLDPENVGCFIVGMTCLQVANNKGECVPPGEVPDPPEECDVVGDCDVHPDPDCFDRVCEENLCGFVATGDPSCEPAGPVTIIPTMGQWGMIIAVVFLGIFAIIRLRSIKDSELS